MSKYTTQIRWICESYNNNNLTKIDDIIDNAIPHIFDFNFPLFDEDYRNHICHHILLHYYTEEIAFETVGLWKLKLESRLFDIMPYYNKLYETVTLDYNPLYNFKKVTTHKGTSNTKTNDNEKTNTSVKQTIYDLTSDTPQGGLTGVDEERYLSSVNKNINNSNTDNNKITDNNKHTIDDYVTTIEGKEGTQSYSSLIAEFRKNLLNVDLMLIDELKDLFFMLWE